MRCNRSEECITDNSVCSDNRCDCPPNRVFSQFLNQCVAERKANCNSDEEWTSIGCQPKQSDHGKKILSLKIIMKGSPLLIKQF